MTNGSGKIFLGILTLLLTIALSVGGYTLSQISNLYETKVSIREVDQMRERLVRIENKLDAALAERYPVAPREYYH